MSQIAFSCHHTFNTALYHYIAMNDAEKHCQKATLSDDEKRCQKAALNDVMCQIVEPNSSYAYSMIAIVKRHIQRYGLTCEPCEIISEAYLRGLIATDRGKRIQHWRAWIKKTIHNIVRERFRKQGKEFLIDPQSSSLDRALEVEDCCDDSYECNILIFQQALQQMRADDPNSAELMDWRILEDMSWQQVYQRLVDQGRSPSSLEALRKQYSRAKHKLRRIFHELGGKYRPLNR